LKRLKLRLSVYYNSSDVNALKMVRTTFHNRPAVQLENADLRVTVLATGGHIAEILHKRSGISPLWIPPWTDEESVDFGDNCETGLLRGIMGHNVCLDLFGPPSDAEAAAGGVAHSEGGIVPYEFEARDGGLIARCVLKCSQLSFERSMILEGHRVKIMETVGNLSVFDRPIAWTQHVTLGPPFLEPNETRFHASATKSMAMEGSAHIALEHCSGPGASGGYTTYLMDPNSEKAWFIAFSPGLKVAAGFVWRRSDFPWMGIWEENCSREHSPWNGRTLARGMEFGVSPFPETRRRMIERGTLFDTPCYRWIEAKARLSVEYYAAITQADTMPESL